MDTVHILLFSASQVIKNEQGEAGNSQRMSVHFAAFNLLES